MIRLALQSISKINRLMPLISSNYLAPRFFKNADLQTIYSTLFRWVKSPEISKERLEISDGDFLDLDWLKQDSKHLVIISHGMEGSSNSIYVKGLLRSLASQGWDALAWNFRGCSGEPNRTPRFYHSGASSDLSEVVLHASTKAQYESISLVGFSMGGNITLKFLGETASSLPLKIKNAVAVSVPCDLAGAAYRLAELRNIVYMRRFLSLFKGKMEEKSLRFPTLYNMRGYKEIKDFKAFDSRYTAPIHGFNSAEEYWELSSSKNFVSRIGVPTLILNALDDPFLSPECFPYKQAEESKFLYLETPKNGGHVGFLDFKERQQFWSEKRILEFLKSN